MRPDSTIEALTRLKPVFSETGTITAGNSSPISAGAAALVLMSPRKAQEPGLPALATFRAWGATAGPLSLLPQPSTPSARPPSRSASIRRDSTCTS